MNIKICEYPGCNKEFYPKRKDARFCSSSCKAKNWAAYHPIVNEKKVPPLRTSTEKIQLLYKKEIQVENPEYLKINEQKTILKWKQNHLMKEINRKHKELEDALSDTQRSIYALGSAAGAIIGYNKKKNKIRNTILGTGLGLAGAYFVDKATEKIRNENKDVLKQKLEDELTSLNESLTNINKEIAALGLQSIGVVKYITKIIEVPAEQANKEVNEKQKENAVLHEDVKNDDTKNLIIAPDSKIVKSTDLDKIKFEEIPFTGKWFDFFGNPSPNFLCLIFGLPGSGKSTFSISFAKYLAENFGLVVYISGEEGISKTLKDKLNLTGAKSDYLYIADWRSYAAITENLKKDPFNFIFIDSLDTLKIGPDELRILRNMHSNSAFVTIAQSTKDGKMRGSQELNHDSDITVQVDKGTAVSIKNRFKESGKEFGIFK